MLESMGEDYSWRKGPSIWILSDEKSLFQVVAGDTCPAFGKQRQKDCCDMSLRDGGHSSLQIVF